MIGNLDLYGNQSLLLRLEGTLKCSNAQGEIRLTLVEETPQIDLLALLKSVLDNDLISSPIMGIPSLEYRSITKSSSVVCNLYSDHGALKLNLDFGEISYQLPNSSILVKRMGVLRTLKLCQTEIPCQSQLMAEIGIGKAEPMIQTNAVITLRDRNSYKILVPSLTHNPESAKKVLITQLLETPSLDIDLESIEHSIDYKNNQVMERIIIPSLQIGTNWTIKQSILVYSSRETSFLKKDSLLLRDLLTGPGKHCVILNNQPLSSASIIFSSTGYQIGCQLLKDLDLIPGFRFCEVAFFMKKVPRRDADIKISGYVTILNQDSEEAEGCALQMRGSYSFADQQWMVSSTEMENEGLSLGGLVRAVCSHQEIVLKDDQFTNYLLRNADLAVDLSDGELEFNGLFRDDSTKGNLKIQLICENNYRDIGVKISTSNSNVRLDDLVIGDEIEVLTQSTQELQIRYNIGHRRKIGPT